MEDLKISEEEGKIHNIFAEGTTFKALALREELVEACDKLGWATPTHIQAESIPHALEGRDMIGLAQTGSGKTGAFALPILHALLENPQPFFACVIAPIRELAAQISKHFEALGSIVGVKCATLMGGLSKMDETIALGKRPHIITLEFLTDNTEHANIGKPTIPSFNTLVATPGRLLDHLSNTKGFSLRTLKYLVLDEADKLLNADFEKVIKEILEEIPRDRKTYLFSATMTEKVGKLKRACLKNPVKVEASSKYSTNDTLKQEFLFIPAKYKDVYLVYLLNEMRENTSMIFTRTCESTRLLALILRNLGFRAIPLHGQMTEPKRLGALNKFKGSQCNILVCTDVGSRGLDMQVDLVINYDIPQNSKDYCHRVGRTARAGRSGMALSLVNQYEVEWFRHIENRIEKKLSIYPTEAAEVLLLADSVTDAKRKALTDIKENGGSRKRRRNGEEEDEEIDTDFAAGFKKKSKSFKKSTKSKRR